MSLGYAERLSFREDLGGRLGDPEILEQAQEVLQKVEQLTDLVRAAKSVVAFTGAGISTACGIPDFRGPNGVWTMQRQGKPLPKAKTSFLYAQPSLTHMALLGLMQGGKLKYICSQNVDSLHLRSGVPRSELAELHGNCFAERCKKCKTEYVRDFEMDTVGFKPTGRMCTKPKCSGYLVDHILDWEDPLPPAELKATEQHASAADVSICLGTSLQIIPAANLPLRTVKAGGDLAIINLQATPKDKKATVVIHAKVDQVMALLMQKLGMPIPAYVRTDRLLLSHKAVPSASPSASQSSQQQQQDQQQQADGSSSSSWSFTLTIASVHGSECPLPMVASARVSFYAQAAVDARAAQPSSTANSSQAAAAAAAAGALDSAAAAAAPAQPGPVDVQGLPEVLPAQEVSGAVPWQVIRACPAGLQDVAVVVQLQLIDAADADNRQQQVHYSIKQPAPPKPTPTNSRGTRGATAKQRQQEQQPDNSEVVSFVTQLRDYSSEQAELAAALLEAAGVSNAPPVQQHTGAEASNGVVPGAVAGASDAAPVQQQEPRVEASNGVQLGEAAVVSNAPPSQPVAGVEAGNGVVAAAAGVSDGQPLKREAGVEASNGVTAGAAGSGQQGQQDGEGPAAAAEGTCSDGSPPSKRLKQE